MASPQSSNGLSSEVKVTHYDFDPDATTATDIAWVDMRDFDKILFSFFRTIGTSDVTVKVLANSSSTGAGTDVEIKSLTNAEFGDPDAVGDYAFVECTAQEIAQEAADAGVADVRYVTLNVAFGTGTDEGVVTYIRKGLRKYSGLTANNIA